MVLLASIPPPPVLWSLLLVTLSFIIISLFYSPPLKRHNQPLRRAPDHLPLVGNGLHFLRDRFTLLAWFTRCERLYPQETLQISVPSLPPGVIISSPTNVDFVFKHEGIFSKGTFFKERSWDLFGHGIINVDGELWRLQRRAGLSFLNTANLKLLTDEELPQILSQTISALKSVAATTPAGHPIDLQAFFHDITTQLMGHMAYGMEMRAGDPFTHAFEYASGATANRVQNPLWRLTELFTGSRMRHSIATIRRYGREIVSNAVVARKITRESPESQSRKPVGQGSLIHSLLDSIEDEQLVADAALNYLSAGRDTTAQALTWTFLLLSQHPAVRARLVSEVDSLAGSPPTQQSLPYTLSVFYEALRHYPPIPFELKQAEEPVTLPDGTFLPAKSIVLWCPWAMNRSFAIWGPDADEYRPERWLVPDDSTTGSGAFKVLNKSPAEFPVFNGGPRTCLGKKMAEAVAVRTIAAVVSEFDFTLRCNPNRRSGSSLTLPMEGGLPVNVTLRSLPK